MQIRFLIVTGPNKSPASVDFGPGLNVIYGGSNTGKSHILRLIDFALGAKTAPEPIPEQAGYDLLNLGVLLDDGREYTFVRALQGGNIRVIDGLFRTRPGGNEGVVVSALHSGKSSLSKLLLEKLGALGARIRTDATGKTRELSFRDLERLSIVDETKVQDVLSPVLSGQYITKTAETSTFKYIVTGVDDSALEIGKTDPSQQIKQAAQLEMLDRQIREAERAIAEADQDHEDLLQQDANLDQEISQSFLVQEISERDYRSLTNERRDQRQSIELLSDRVDEIETLVSRFRLLQAHYQSDIQRLDSIVEAGNFFVMESGANCPVCGAAPENHRPDFSCEGDVAEIAASAEAEKSELNTRAVELAATIANLLSEQEALRSRIADLSEDLRQLDVKISREVPTVQTVRQNTNVLVNRKISIQRELDLIRRRDNLLRQREELGVSAGYDSSTIVAQQHLDGATLDALCQEVEKELQSWEFPDAKRVFFEIQKMDIAVSGKSRAANGKGVRALLHGAFSVALMKFSRERKYAHPGFLVIDSLFITYKDPSDASDQEIAKTPLRDKAFQSFLNLSKDLQLIIIENVDVPNWLSERPQCLHFSGTKGVGRAGLFPPLGE